MEDFALLESPKLISRKIGTAVLYFIPCYWNTVWKFNYFPAIQIFREVNFVSLSVHSAKSWQFATHILREINFGSFSTSEISNFWDATFC